MRNRLCRMTSPISWRRRSVSSSSWPHTGPSVRSRPRWTRPSPNLASLHLHLKAQLPLDLPRWPPPLPPWSSLTSSPPWRLHLIFSPNLRRTRGAQCQTSTCPTLCTPLRTGSHFTRRPTWTWSLCAHPWSPARPPARPTHHPSSSHTQRAKPSPAAASCTVGKAAATSSHPIHSTLPPCSRYKSANTSNHPHINTDLKDLNSAGLKTPLSNHLFLLLLSSSLMHMNEPLKHVACVVFVFLYTNIV